MYNPRKAAQVIAYLALKDSKRALQVIKAVKLVYLSDKESIRLWGFPILEERRVSMPHGPVNSETYSHINGEHDLASCGWSDFLENRANHVLAVATGVGLESLDELSEADIIALDATWEAFGHFGQWELRDWTHRDGNVPEWEDPGGSSVSIPLERMMRHAGVSDPESQAMLCMDFDKIERVLESLRKT